MNNKIISKKVPVKKTISKGTGKGRTTSPALYEKFKRLVNGEEEVNEDWDQNFRNFLEKRTNPDSIIPLKERGFLGEILRNKSFSFITKNGVPKTVYFNCGNGCSEPVVLNKGRKVTHLISDSTIKEVLSELNASGRLEQMAVQLDFYKNTVKPLEEKLKVQREELRLLTEQKNKAVEDRQKMFFAWKSLMEEKPIEISIGFHKKAVLKILGEPKQYIRMDGKEIFEYGARQYWFEDEVLTEIAFNEFK